jgi:hypothetical protein
MNVQRSISAEHRRALRLLAGNPLGCAEAILLAHGFKTRAAGSPRARRSRATQPGTVRATRRRIKVVWVMITDAGQQALADT